MGVEKSVSYTLTPISVKMKRRKLRAGEAPPPLDAGCLLSTVQAGAAASPLLQEVMRP